IAPQNRAAEAQGAFGGGVAEQAQRIANEYGDVTQAAPQQGGGWGGQQNAAQQAPQQETANTHAQGNGASGWGAQQQTPAPAEKPKRTRTAKAAADPTGPAGDVAVQVALIHARSKVVAAVIASDADATVDDIVEISRDLM